MLYSRFRTVFSCETLGLSIVPTCVLDLDSFSRVLCRNCDPVKDMLRLPAGDRSLCAFLIFFIFFFADRHDTWAITAKVKMIQIYFTFVSRSRKINFYSVFYIADNFFFNCPLYSANVYML